MKPKEGGIHEREGERERRGEEREDGRFLILYEYVTATDYSDGARAFAPDRSYL